MQSYFQLAILFVVFPFALFAEDVDESKFFCNWGGQQSFDQTVLPDLDDVQPQSFDQMVQSIVDKTGLAKNFVTIPANVPNAAATIRNGTRILAYNPRFFAQIKSQTGTDWSVVSVLAHEIGHHLNGHTLLQSGSRPPIELEADKFSGFVLASMGAVPAEAVAAIKTLPNARGSLTHPATSDRIEAILDGWVQWCKTDPICVRSADPDNRDGLLTLRFRAPANARVPLNQSRNAGYSTCTEPTGVTCSVTKAALGTQCRCTSVVFGAAPGKITQ